MSSQYPNIVSQTCSCHDFYQSECPDRTPMLGGMGKIAFSSNDILLEIQNQYDSPIRFIGEVILPIGTRKEKQMAEIKNICDELDQEASAIANAGIKHSADRIQELTSKIRELASEASTDKAIATEDDSTEAESFAHDG